MSVRIPPDGDTWDYYIGPDGQVWRLLYYATQPTATVQNLKTGEKRGGVVGSLVLEPFRRLVPEGDT